MAHLINVNSITQAAEAAFAFRPAWHGLGTVKDGYLSSEDVHGVVGWNVLQRPLAALHSGGDISIPSHKAIVRGDTMEPIGIVGRDYQVVQNTDLIAIADSLMQDGIIRYASAMVLRGGSTVAILAYMPSVTDEIVEGDSSMRFVLLANTHDGTKPLYILPTSVRVVCANTLRMATASQIGMRHSGNMQEKIADARKVVSQYDEKFTLFRDSARKLATTKMSADAKREYLKVLFPEPAKSEGKGATMRTNLLKVIDDNAAKDAAAIPSAAGTWWNMVNAVTAYYTHQRTTKAQTIAPDSDSPADIARAEAAMQRQRDENRFFDGMDGDGADRKDKALSLALTFAR